MRVLILCADCIFVCGLKFLNELHGLVLKKFCLDSYGECAFFIWNSVFSRHQLTHYLFNTKFYPVFQTFIPNNSEIKYIISYWYSQHTRYGFEPISIRIPASHYFRYLCLECVIDVESFLNFLNAVLTSYQPQFQSAVIWN